MIGHDVDWLAIIVVDETTGNLDASADALENLGHNDLAEHIRQFGRRKSVKSRCAYPWPDVYPSDVKRAHAWCVYDHAIIGSTHAKALAIAAESSVLTHESIEKLVTIADSRSSRVKRIRDAQESIGAWTPEALAEWL